MITNEEICNLFNLLEIYHSDKKAKRDKATLAAWRMVLSPWSYEQVKQAAIKRAQSGNRFFPDAPEIAAFCPPLDLETGMADRVLSGRDLERWQKQRAMVERYDERKRQLREAGLPEDIWAARAAGMSCGEYDQIVESAGLGFDDIFCLKAEDWG